VDIDSGVVPGAPSGRDVEARVIGRSKPVQTGCVTMAQHRPRNREDRRKPVSLPSQSTVTDGVDTTVKLNEPAGRHPTIDHRLRQTRRGQLPPSDHTPLRSGDASDPAICG
jgi:hypothetical protein